GLLRCCSGEQLLGPLASGFKGAAALHVRIEHFQGPAAGVDLVVMGEIGEPFEDAEQVLVPGAAQDLHITGAALGGWPSVSTSMTYIVRSANSGENVAARLSPPDSIRIRSRPGNNRLISATAARFIEASSRIAVCGQPPVSTPRMRSGGRAPLRVRYSASSRV